MSRNNHEWIFGHTKNNDPRCWGIPPNGDECELICDKCSNCGECTDPNWICKIGRAHV